VFDNQRAREGSSLGEGDGKNNWKCESRAQVLFAVGGHRREKRGKKMHHRLFISQQGERERRERKNEERLGSRQQEMTKYGRGGKEGKRNHLKHQKTGVINSKRKRGRKKGVLGSYQTCLLVQEKRKVVNFC